MTTASCRRPTRRAPSRPAAVTSWSSFTPARCSGTMMLTVAVALLLLCDSVHFRVRCFNLDTRLPIVKRGEQGSYFGYSVAGHQSFDELKGQVENSWILVGAPLGKNLQPNTTRSGALWKCPLTSSYDDCIQVITDGKRSFGTYDSCPGASSEYDSSIDSTSLLPPSMDEIKEGQWLGVTVRSQGRGGKVMVCAHRYINRGTEFQWGIGLCYVLTQHLDLDQCWEPCRSKPMDHTQFGYCQAGTSSMIFEDDTAVIGTPGVYNWKGYIYVVAVSDDFLKRDNTIYTSPIRESDPLLHKSSYLGMSVTGAAFFGEQKIVYAVGAPRANGTGQVVLFSKIKGFRNITENMEVNKIISGEQFASSFGYELATADLNGDKNPDLIVGAPFYFTKDSGGAVYIYMNKNHCLDCQLPIKLVGKPESRFGFAITNLGDLNKDGYDDIAIGAPYEGNGVIYVYLGSIIGIDIEPSQVIRAEDLTVNNLEIRTLGYSLNGNGMDLDQNGYPDLISGAYESDMAILIRARPIVNITISVIPSDKLHNIDPTKTECLINGSPVTCFTFQTCCLLESVVKAGKGGVQLRYKLEAETFYEGHKFSRVWFGPDHTFKSQTVENVVSVDYNNKKTCQNHTAYLKENTMDIQSPIALRISYSLVENNIPVLKSGDPVFPLDDLPVLNQNQAEKTFFATFHKDCGDDDICESEIQVNAELVLPKTTDNEFELVMGHDVKILLNTTVKNHGESAYESKLFIIHPYSLNYIGTVKSEDTKKVDCNPFNKTLVICALGNPYKISASTNIQLRFDPKELKNTENHLKFIVFSNSTSQEKEPQSPIILYTNVIRHAELSLKGSARPETVFYGGQVKDDSLVKYFDEAGSRILHTYQVFNSGPWKVSNLEVHIDWPFQVASHYTRGKWLLYLDEKPYVEAISGGDCLMFPGQVNPLGLQVRPGVQEISLSNIRSENSAINNLMVSKLSTYTMKSNSTGHYQNRIRREQNIAGSVETDDNGKIYKVVNMNCLNGNARCIKFSCVINNLERNQEASIFIKARLWNSTLLQEFPKVNRVQIISRAKIIIPTELFLQQNRSDDEVSVVTNADIDKLEQQETEEISWWMFILAILIGLILLILLTWLLWKLGFFKRRRPDPTLSGNIEKHRVEEYYDY